MQFLTEKQLANLSTQRLLEIKKKLNKIIGTRNFHLEDDMERGIATESDYEFLREHEEYHSKVKEVLAHREHIEPKTKKVKFNRGQGRQLKREAA